MRVYLDANIIVSILNAELPLFYHTGRLITLATSSKYSFYTSPTTLAIAFYFCSKKYNREIAKKKIESLCKRIEIAVNSSNDPLLAASNNAITDFEDGLQYYAAKNAKCKCIVTNDYRDFHFSDIEILDAESFLQKHVLK